MSKDESILSNSTCGTAGNQAHLVKVLANVVETQRTIANQFGLLLERVEEARNESRRNISALTEEIRRLEIRSDKMIDSITTQLISQNEALTAAHSAERAQLIDQNSNLLSLLKPAVVNPPRPAAAPSQPMQAYNQGMQANAMFANQEQVAEQMNQLAPQQMAMLQAQMRNWVHSQQQQLALAGNAAARAAPSVATVAAPAQMPSVPAPAVPVIPQAVPVPAVTQPTVPKVEVKPASPATAVQPASSASVSVPAKPLFSFGSPSSAANKPLFGGAAASSAQTNASSVTSAASAGTTTTVAKSAFSFIPPKPVATIKTEVNEDAAEDENEDHVEEYEPDVQFQPVIPLPDMVEVKTGEEQEKVLFDDRCKLFRFAAGEWKERATGPIRVLKNEQTGKHRVVVRRDQMVLVPLEEGFMAQVHKVAANFHVVEGVRIAQMTSSPKAVVWSCLDFSEDDVKGISEQLSARFSSPEKAELFMGTVNEIVDGLSKGTVTPKKGQEKAKGTEVVVKPAAPAAPAAPATTSAAGFGDKFKMAAGDWECNGCYVTNKSDSDECVACGEGNPTAERKSDAPPANPFGKNATIFNANTSASSVPKFSFGLGGGSSPAAAAPAAAAAKTDASKPPVTAISFANTSTAATPAVTTTKFTFSQAAAAASKEDDKASSFKSVPTAVQSSNAFGGGITAAKPAAPTFSFRAVPFSPTSTTPAVTKATTTTASTIPAFSFKTPDPSKTTSIFGGSQKTLFGASNPSTPVDAAKEKEKKETPGTVFGSSFMGAGFDSVTNKTSIFDQKDKIEEGQKKFAALAKSKPFGQSAAVAATAADATVDAKEEGGEEAAAHPEEYEPDVQFAPVIPLPDLVEVKTGEEDEKVLFSARSKVYRYVRELKEYKERGTGEIKLLHDEGANKFRIVMRREQVHKLCANFAVTKAANLIEKAGQPNVRSLVVMDFSESDEGELETLCLKFKNEEIACMFAKAFQDAQAQLS